MDTDLMTNTGSSGTILYYLNAWGAAVVSSTVNKKNSIRKYNKSVLQKFKNLNVYTYTYKKEFNEDAKFKIDMS